MDSLDHSDTVKQIIRRELKVGSQVYSQNQELCLELGELIEKVTHLEVSLEKIYSDIQSKDQLIDKVIERNNILENKIKCQTQSLPTFQENCLEIDFLKREIEFYRNKMKDLKEKYERSQQRREKENFIENLEESQSTEEMCEKLLNMRKYRESLQTQLVESEKCTCELEQELKSHNEKYDIIRTHLKNREDDFNILRQQYNDYQRYVDKLKECVMITEESNPNSCSQTMRRKQEITHKFGGQDILSKRSFNANSRNFVYCSDFIDSCQPFEMQSQKNTSSISQRNQRSRRKCSSLGSCKNITELCKTISSRNLSKKLKRNKRDYFSTSNNGNILSLGKQNSQCSPQDCADRKNFIEASLKRVLDHLEMNTRCEITIKIQTGCTQRQLSRDGNSGNSTKCCSDFKDVPHPKDNETVPAVTIVPNNSRSELNNQSHCPKTSERINRYRLPGSSSFCHPNPSAIVEKFRFRNRSTPCRE